MSHESHESAYKISIFRKMYVPGLSPIMIIVDQVEEGERANGIEKEWRTYYTNKGAILTNNIGKLQRHLKVQLQNMSYNGIDLLFENWKSYASGFFLLVLLIVAISFYLYKSKGVQFSYEYSI